MNPSHPKTPIGMDTLRIWLVMLFTLLLAACGSGPQSLPAEPTAQFGDSDLADAKLELATKVLDANSLEFGQAMQKAQDQIEKLESAQMGEVGAQAVLPGASGYLYYTFYWPNLAKPYSIVRQDQTSSLGTSLYLGTKTIDSVAGTLYGDKLYASIHDGNDYEIYYFNSANADPTQLTNDSVDNTYVTTDKTGTVVAWQEPGNNGLSQVHLRIYDLNGTYSDSAFSGGVPYRQPSLSRNARRLVWVQDDVQDSITLKRLFNMAMAPSVLYQNGNVTYPSIDDDGTRIAFLLENGDFDNMRVYNTVTFEMELHHQGNLQRPFITADGFWLAYAEKMNASQGWRIRTTNLITGNVAEATSYFSPIETRNPHWEKPRPFPTSHGLLKTFSAQTDGQAGYRVDVDGDWMVVGSWKMGTVYVLKRNDLQWEVAKQLFPDAGFFGASFGSSVAISADTVIVGSPGEDSKKGAVYIFQRNQGGSNNWGKVKKITQPMLDESGFGNSVDIAGDLAVAAPAFTDTGGSRVYIYGRNKGGDNQWGSFTSKSFGVDKVAYQPLDVAVADDKVAVGVPGEKVNGVQLAGAVYLYARNTGGWNNFGQLKKMTPEGPDLDATLGFSVAMTADTLVAGAPNANKAYVYERNQGGNNAWGKVKTLKASDQQSGDRFGHAVDVGLNKLIVVGAPNEDGKGSNRGASYVFRQGQGGASMWGEVSRLTAYQSSAKDGDNFGTSVATSSAFIVVGIPGLDKDKQNQGGIYTFKE